MKLLQSCNIANSWMAFPKASLYLFCLGFPTLSLAELDKEFFRYENINHSEMHYAGVRSRARQPVYFDHYIREPDYSDTSPKQPLKKAPLANTYFGLQSGFPEVFAIDLRQRLSSRWSLRLVAAPEIPFNIRVELPQDKLTSRGGIVIEHPPTHIPFKARFGPVFALEAWWFPFAKNFFVQFGIAYREFHLNGRVRSPLIVRPQGSSDSLTTRTEFSLRAKSATKSTLLRTGIGWSYSIGQSGYWFFQPLGILHPVQSRTRVDVEGGIFSPGVDNDEIAGALLEMKNLKERELSDKAREEIRPVEKLTLPLVSIGAGWRF